MPDTEHIKTASSERGEDVAEDVDSNDARIAALETSVGALHDEILAINGRMKDGMEMFIDETNRLSTKFHSWIVELREGNREMGRMVDAYRGLLGSTSCGRIALSGALESAIPAPSSDSDPPPVPE